MPRYSISGFTETSSAPVTTTCRCPRLNDFSAILVAHGEQGDAQKGGRTLLEAAEQIGLVARIEPERMDQVRADEGPFQVVKCRGLHWFTVVFGLLQGSQYT